MSDHVKICQDIKRPILLGLFQPNISDANEKIIKNDLAALSQCLRS